jgi:hypothetical protein
MTIPVICIAMDGVVRSAAEQAGAVLRALSEGRLG